MQKDINARIYVLPIAAVIALYVLASLIVALARFPGQEFDARSGYRLQDASIVTDPEVMGELFNRTPSALIGWSPDDRHHPSVTSKDIIITKPNVSAMVACVSKPRP